MSNEKTPSTLTLTFSRGNNPRAEDRFAYVLTSTDPQKDLKLISELSGQMDKAINEEITRRKKEVDAAKARTPRGRPPKQQAPQKQEVQK